MNSWKTTLCGVLTLLAAGISLVGVPLLDADPLTLPNYTAFGAALATAVGLFMARDNSKTSEAAGALTPPEIK